MCSLSGEPILAANPLTTFIGACHPEAGWVLVLKHGIVIPAPVWGSIAGGVPRSDRLLAIEDKSECAVKSEILVTPVFMKACEVLPACLASAAMRALRVSGNLRVVGVGISQTPLRVLLR